jgi:hypothetical protein
VNKKGISLAEEIERLYEMHGGRPMPDADIDRARLQLEPDDSVDDYRFVGADLSNYWMYIAGLACRAGDLARETLPYLQEARAHLRRGFFDWSPEYGSIEPLMRDAQFPDLYSEFSFHEKLRELLLSLLSELLADQDRPAG